MPDRIYLIGFMGSGKTSHGKQIARMMGYDFADMDTWIEERTGKTVSLIFQEDGEPFFRQKETESIIALSKLEKVVIATGGGAPCFGANLELMKATGLVVYLHLSPAALLDRLKNARTERPLLAGKSEAEMLETIKSMLQQREPFYNQAHMIIDGLEGVNERVVNAIQRRLK
jgi:shikimate kinase